MLEGVLEHAHRGQPQALGVLVRWVRLAQNRDHIFDDVARVTGDNGLNWLAQNRIGN